MELKDYLLTYQAVLTMLISNPFNGIESPARSAKGAGWRRGLTNPFNGIESKLGH